jgi:hypothetical protein
MTVAPLVGVHGIWNYGYQRKAAGNLTAAVDAISTDWAGWIGQGLGRLDVAIPVPARVPVAYYADCLFRGHRMGVDNPARLDPFARQLFIAWVEELRQEQAGRELVPLRRQGWLTIALRQSAEWFTEQYGDRALRVVTATVSELATYFDPKFGGLREQARQRVAEVVHRNRPRVLLAHSLGSVVAYEALCADPSLAVELFVTLGSPLAMHGVVFERLRPEPIGRGIRPQGAALWVNIADHGDPVAVPRGRLPERFDGVDRDHETSIHLVDPHLAKSYLGCAELGQELAPYLRLPAAGR